MRQGVIVGVSDGIIRQEPQDSYMVPLETSKRAHFWRLPKFFLLENIGLFNFMPDLNDLIVVNVESRSNATDVVFQQTFDNIPVYGAVYTVHISNDKRVYLSGGQYYPDVFLETTVPYITVQEALIAAQNHLGSYVPASDLETDINLFIKPYGNEFRLVWEVKIPAQYPFGTWVYLIFAEDASILGGGSMLNMLVTGDGDVYEKHPFAGDPVNKDLTNLYEPGYELDGYYDLVLNDDGPEAFETDLSFVYDTDNTHFDEVMLYYHANVFQDTYVDDELGYPYLSYPNTQERVTLIAHSDVTGSIPGSTIIEFWDGDDINYRDFAKENVVIYHEYFHLVTDRTTETGLDCIEVGLCQEMMAMDEAFSDYFAGSFAETETMGEYVNVYSNEQRHLSNSYTMDNWNDLPTYWERSQIFSGALWDMRESHIGQTTTDEIIFEGLNNLDQPDPEFMDGRDCIIAADNLLYGGQHVTTIQNIFAARGIGEPVNTISGTLTQNETWSGFIRISGDVTVPSDITLIILPGTVAKFNPSTRLIIYGSLIAEGNSNQRILFTSGSTTAYPGVWNGVKIYTSSSHSSIQYADIEYSTNGLYIVYTDKVNDLIVHKCKITSNSSAGIRVTNSSQSPTIEPTISYSIIKDNWSRGIYIYKCSPTISHCRIEQNSSYGIYVYQAGSPLIEYSLIENNRYDGLISVYGTPIPRIHRSTIRYNSWNGVSAFYGGNIQGDDPGRNLVHYNSKNGLLASHNAVITFGGASTGYHWIANNSLCQVKSENGGFYDARNTYWFPSMGGWCGAGIIVPMLYYAPSPVGWGHSDDYNPTLDGDPPIGGITASQSPYLNDNTNYTPLLVTVINQGINGSDSSDWFPAAKTISYVRALKKMGRNVNVNINIVRTFSQNSNVHEGVRKTLGLFVADNLIYTQGPDSAISFLKNLRTDLQDSTLELIAGQGLIYLHEMNDTENASRIGQQIDSLCTDSVSYWLYQLAIQDYLEMNELVGYDLAKSTVHSPDQNLTPRVYILRQNYPNPFNDITTISYELPEASIVNLRIYDLLGSEVTELINGTMSDGVKQTIWNGKNRHGNPVSSGIYVCLLTASSKENNRRFSKSNKMLLLK